MVSVLRPYFIAPRVIYGCPHRLPEADFNVVYCTEVVFIGKGEMSVINQPGEPSPPVCEGRPPRAVWRIGDQPVAYWGLIGDWRLGIGVWWFIQFARRFTDSSSALPRPCRRPLPATSPYHPLRPHSRE